MLSEEEKKAIKVLEQYKQECIEEYKIEIDDVEENIDEQHASYLHQQIEATYRILKLITKLQKENEILKSAFDKQTADMSNNLLELQQKDKQIDLMAEVMFKNNTAQLIIEYGIENKEQIIKEFEKLVKEKGE